MLKCSSLSLCRSRRITYLIGVAVAIAVLLMSFYLEYFHNVIPCPLCMLQRLCFALLGFLCVIGVLIHANALGGRLINLSLAFFSLIGMGLAGRQVWLQHHVTEVSNECGVSLQYLLHVLPVNEVLQRVLTSSAECTQRGWEFLSIGMAGWALIFFCFFLLLALDLLFRKKY